MGKVEFGCVRLALAIYVAVAIVRRYQIVIKLQKISL